MGRTRLACVVIALGASVGIAAPPGPSAAQPAAQGGAGGAAKTAAQGAAQADQPSSAAISRLTKEKAQLSAELVKKDQQIAALTRVLKENGIEVPEEAGGGAAAAGAASAPGRPAAAKRSSAAGETSAADAAPAAAPAPTKGPWEVSVVSNEEPSQNELKDQLAEAIGKLKFADEQLAQAKHRHDSMAGAREEYRTSRGRWDYKSKYTNAQMAEPRRDVAKAEADKKRAGQTVARLERQIADAGKSHMVVGQLADGTTVELTAAGPAQVQLARGLQVGERYRVVGTARLDEGTLRVRMSSAVPIAGGGGAAARAGGAGAAPGAGRAAGGARRPSPVPVVPTAPDEAMEAADDGGAEAAADEATEPEAPVEPPARRPQPRRPAAQPKAAPF